MLWTWKSRDASESLDSTAPGESPITDVTRREFSRGTASDGRAEVACWKRMVQASLCSKGKSATNLHSMSNTLPLGHFCAPSQCKPRSCNVQRLSSSDDWPCRRPRRSIGKRHVNMAGENAPRDRVVLKSFLVQAWRRLGPQARSSSVSSTLKHAITATLTG